MYRHLERKKEVEEKYKTELDNATKQLDDATKQLRDVEGKIINEVKEIERIEGEEQLKYLLLKCQEIEEKGGIKTKGITIQEVFFSLGNCGNLTFLRPEIHGSTFVVRWYVKIKELYPSYSIFTDVIEGKREYFDKHIIFTFFINGIAFYQLYDDKHDVRFYIVEKTKTSIVKYDSLEKLERKKKEKRKKMI